MNNDSILLTSEMLHDIRNKLNRILGYSEILQEEDSLSEEQIKMAKSIATSAQQIELLLSTKKKKLIDDDIIPPKNTINKKTKILIVDDNEDNRNILELFLKKFPLQIFFAQNGLTSIEIANIEQPDLIFMDLHLPDISGKEAAKIIKRHQSDIKIIALTGDMNAIEFETYENSIFEKCLAKPFYRNQIQEIIATFTDIMQEESIPANKLSIDYLSELTECAKVGRVSCLENLIDQCDNAATKKFLKEKLFSFNFEEIILWAQRVDNEPAISES
ncbi:response regulator [bacterium]|nr:response regulator [bacterium]MBU1883048.1 response regulator [bacterium]